MITPLLEKAILKGIASYSKYTFGYGMYANLQIPEGKLVIITDITWHNFLNPYKDNGTVTVAEFFKYSEYQIKIDGFKSKNFLTFRNLYNIYNNYNNTVQKSFDMLGLNNSLFILPLKPIQKDVFFVCEKFIKTTISRNVFFDTFNSNYGTLSQEAAQQNEPNGVQNISLTRRLQMNSNTPNTMYYTPPGLKDAGLASAGARDRETYSQDVERQLSQIYPPDSGFTAIMNNPTLTQPLVEFGIVTINSNEWDKLQTL